MFSSRLMAITNLQLTKHSVRKRALYSQMQYNYDYLMKEYYAEAISEGLSNRTYHVKKPDTSVGFVNSLKKILKLNTKIHNSSDEEIKWMDYKFVYRILKDYRNREPIGILVRRLWKVIRIWFLVYLAVALPLWCTKGWCCCCLFCKFFRPYQTIEDAKKYMGRNPPGVFSDANGRYVPYEPSEHEHETYEEFEHLVRIT